MKEFYKKATELDILKSMANPGVQDLERLLKIIQEDETLTVYFYENNNNGAWLRLLKEAREFETLGNADNVGPKERLKAIYLAEVAGEKPEELLDIIGRIDAKDVFIQGSFLDALLKMPVDKAVLGTSIVKSYLEGRDAKIWYFVGQRAAQIMVDFAEKHANEAFEIAEALLEVWKPGDKKRSRLREIEAKFEPFEYENLVFKYYKKLWDMYPFQAAMLLVQIFERYLKEIQGDKDYEVSSLFYISLERLDRIERIGGDVVAVIVAGICETGKVVIEKRPEKIDELLDYLRELEKHIFERIEMYLLRFVPAGTQRERMSDIIKKRKFLETPGYEYEYKLLLRDKFEDVDSGSKKFFEDWIADQKLDDGDKERISSWFKERETRDATAEDFERIENSRKARELFLVKEKYPKLYEGCKKKSGASDEELAPKPRIGPARAIAPTEGAPISVEDMVKMKPVEAVAYVGDPSRWVIDRKKESVFHTPEEGLASTFKEVVKQRATDYAELSADDLMKLKPSFLSKYFYGLWEVEREKKIQESSLVKVIRQAKAIIDSKGDSEEYKECFKAILDIVQGTLDNYES